MTADEVIAQLCEVPAPSEGVRAAVCRAQVIAHRLRVIANAHGNDTCLWMRYPAGHFKSVEMADAAYRAAVAAAHAARLLSPTDRGRPVKRKKRENRKRRLRRAQRIARRRNKRAAMIARRLQGVPIHWWGIYGIYEGKP